MMDASLAPSLGGAKGLLPLLIGAAVGFLTIRTIL
jgi:hypothetical protein